MKWIKNTSALLAVAWLCAGCAGMVDDWQRYGGGWRTGYVVGFATQGTSVGVVDSDCRPEVPAGGAPAQQFAVVLYATHGGLLKNRVVLLAPDARVRRDDWIQFNIERCDLPASPSPHARIDAASIPGRIVQRSPGS